MQQVIINLLVVFKLAVFRRIKWRILILRSNIIVAPFIIWFYLVHYKLQMCGWASVPVLSVRRCQPHVNQKYLPQINQLINDKIKKSGGFFIGFRLFPSPALALMSAGLTHPTIASLGDPLSLAIKRVKVTMFFLI